MTRLKTAACLLGSALVVALTGATAALPYQGWDAAIAWTIAWTIAATCVAVPLAAASTHTRKDGQ